MTPNEGAVMLQRDVHLPADPERVWTALTEPADLERWFGASVEWELRPGGLAAFREAGGGAGGPADPEARAGRRSRREGRVEQVEPGRRLRFTWWPAGEEDDASEVTYRLTPEEDGTRLTVTERKVPGAEARPPAGEGRAGEAQASVAGRPAVGGEWPALGGEWPAGGSFGPARSPAWGPADEAQLVAWAAEQLVAVG